MKARAMLAGAVLAFSAATAWAQSDAKVDPALEATNKKFTEAFNAFDAKAVASFFAADGTLINPVGNVAHGPEEIAKVFAQDAARFFKGSTSTFTITGAREVGPDTTLADALTRAASSGPESAKTYGLGNGRIVVLGDLDAAGEAFEGAFGDAGLLRFHRNDPRIDVTIHRPIDNSNRLVVFVANPTAEAIEAEVRLETPIASAREVWDDRPVATPDGSIREAMPAYTIRIFEVAL